MYLFFKQRKYLFVPFIQDILMPPNFHTVQNFNIKFYIFYQILPQYNKLIAFNPIISDQSSEL